MSEEALKSLLKDFGLTETESTVYLFLSRHGALKGTEIAKQLRKDKAQIYHILRDLQAKGLVESTLEVPVRFTPVALENVVDSAIKAKRNEATQIENAKKQLLDYWKSTSKTQIELSVEKFVVLDGRQKVFSKIAQMIATTESQLLTIASVPSLLRADQFGIYDEAAKHPKRARILFRFLTKLSQSNLASAKIILREMSLSKLNYSMRIPELAANLSPRMVIRDNREALLFINPPSVAPTEEYDESCLWTNCADLVRAFTSVFEGTWLNSTDIQTKIRDIENAKSSPKDVTIADTRTTNNKYEEALNSVQKEIVAIISQEELVALSKNNPLLKNWLEKDVSVRILTPITSATQETVKRLNQRIEVRHVPSDYMETIVVDNAHLFEFRNTLQESGLRASPDFRYTFYSNDPEHIQKRKKILDRIWLTAQEPSTTTLGSISKGQRESTDSFLEETVPRTIKKMHGAKITTYSKPGSLSYKEVVERMIQAPSNIDAAEVIAKTYGTNCQAIVHLPKQFNLPELLFHVYHIEKHSTFGREEAVLLHPWIETTEGFAYVFSALFTDNPKSLDFWRKVCANSPAEQNIHLVNENAIEVRVHGNTLFAGWAVPLELNQSCIIPPSCLVVEGYGETRTRAWTVRIPSGYKLKTEGSQNEAFVTFLHPSSKYSGPGTDGAVARDVTMEFIKR